MSKSLRHAVIRMRSRVGPIALAAAVGSTAAGCGTLDSLLDVDIGGRVLEETLNDPANAALLSNSVVGTFECAFGAYVVAMGLLTDELGDAQIEPAIIRYDRRDITPEQGVLTGAYSQGDCIGTTLNSLGVYTPLSTARWLADEATKRLESWTDQQVTNRGTLIATAAAYAGYSLVLLGEAMCTAAIDLGPELTRAEVWTLAEERFTKAITTGQAAGAADIRNMALVGRARARLNLGRKLDAATDAGGVPLGYKRLASASGTAAIRENRVFIWNVRGRQVTVDPAFRGLQFGGVADPRVVVTNTGQRGQDNVTPVWIQQKFTTVSSPIELATWEEAQLIMAEAALGQTAVDIINGLHDRASLPHFSSTDAGTISRQIIEERSRELFLESHRLYDMVRYNLPFLPPAGTPYPKQGVYGNSTCLPLPDRERLNNPNL